MDAGDLLNVLSSALIREKQQEKNFFEKLLSLLVSLRPGVTIDPLSGQPSLELKVESQEDIRYGLEHLMQLLSGIENDIVFMLDEFQQINLYPEKNMEQILRTIIQAYPGIRFIFSGSSKHMLEPMFNAAGRPFYQSAELMYLGKIQEDDYYHFISGKFNETGKKINREVVNKIFGWTRMHTYYVQYVCNLLFEWEEDEINEHLVNLVFQRILNSNEPLYITYRNLLSGHQYKLIRAIAAEDGIDKPTSGAFIRKYGLTGASSVNTSLKALAEKELIVYNGDRWLVYDVFFSRWLEYHYSGK
ncbi:MAG: hypothetical protein PVF73_12205 [Bacteroidales bacterium]|jgi:hypothetical protein